MSSAIRLYPVLAVMASDFYRYMPYLYVFNYIGVGKDAVFLGLMSLCLVLLCARLLLFAEKGLAQKLVPVALYMLFSVYALWSYALTIDYMNNSQGIFVIVFLNLAFMAMGIFAAVDKGRVFSALFLLSFVYVGIVAAQVLGGGIALASSGFYSVFSALPGDDTAYQNISTHLGLFSVLSLVRCSGRVPWVTALYVFAFGVGVVLILMVGGRGALASVAVVLFLWMSFGASSSRQLRRGLLVGSLIVPFLGLVLIESGAWLGLESADLIGVRRLLALGDEGDPSARIYLFSKAVELFGLSIKNVIFGAGAGSFSVFTGSFDLRWYPHNIVLELLAEFGLIGLILFFLPLARILYLRRMQLGSIVGSTDPERTAVLVFVFFFVQAIFSGSLGTAWRLVFFLGLLYPGIDQYGSKLSSVIKRVPSFAGYKKVARAHAG